MPRSTKAKRTQPVAPAPPPPPAVSPRLARLCSLGVALAVLLVYSGTIIPTAVDQDSGELVAAAHVLGIAHPTGYPLWTLLGHFFDVLPLGHTSAYRVALASAVPAAAASGLLCWLVMAATGTLLPGLFAGLAFGLWYPTWSQAVLAEVYGLSGFLFSLFLVALWRWSPKRDPRHLFWLALAGGAVAMHHRTAFLSVAPALAMAFWYTQPRRPKTWVLGALLFLVPFLCYLYLPIRAAAHPPVNWTNPTTFGRFYAHAMGKQYMGYALLNNAEVATAQANRLLGESLAGGFGEAPPGTPFASPDPVLLALPALRGVLSFLLALVSVPLPAWGWRRWYQRRRPEALALAVGGLVLFYWVIEWGETSDPKVFLLPLGAVLALCGGWGLAQVQEKLPKLRGRLVAALAGGLVVALLLGANWSRSDRRDQWVHRDRWYAALAQMEPNAIFVSMMDNPTFVITYLQEVEGVRKDVTLLRAAAMAQPWYVDLIRDPELRKVANDSWQQLAAQLRIGGSGTAEYRMGATLFAARLAMYYQGRRPVYALNYLPAIRALPTPPYFLGLSEDIARVSPEPPKTAMARVGAAKPLATFPGAELMSLTLSPDQKIDTGTVVHFTARWRVAGAMPDAYFALALAPNQPTEQWQKAVQNWGNFVQLYPLLYGLPDLPPSSAATAYEQQGEFIIPTNANSGGCSLLGEGVSNPSALWIGSSSGYPPRFGNWTEVARIATLSGSYPTNR